LPVPGIGKAVHRDLLDVAPRSSGRVAPLPPPSLRPLLSAPAPVALLWPPAARVAGSPFGSRRPRCPVSVLVAAAALLGRRAAVAAVLLSGGPALFSAGAALPVGFLPVVAVALFLAGLLVAPGAP
ncbi:hypothetical protein C3R44_21685, partial [Mycobacterium tuberculosis]